MDFYEPRLKKLLQKVLCFDKSPEARAAGPYGQLLFRSDTPYYDDITQFPVYVLHERNNRTNTKLEQWEFTKAMYKMVNTGLGLTKVYFYLDEGQRTVGPSFGFFSRNMFQMLFKPQPKTPYHGVKLYLRPIFYVPEGEYQSGNDGKEVSELYTEVCNSLICLFDKYATGKTTPINSDDIAAAYMYACLTMMERAGNYKFLLYDQALQQADKHVKGKGRALFLIENCTS